MACRCCRAPRACTARQFLAWVHNYSSAEAPRTEPELHRLRPLVPVFGDAALQKFAGELFLALLAVGLAREPPVSEAEIRPAGRQSVALLQQAGETWLSKQSCVSCHQRFFRSWS